jgi:ankyrin repeat protein
LYIASENGECDVVKCLLSSGAEINLCDKRGQSPLSIASMIGHYGDFLSSSHKLISAPELSKHLTTSQCPIIDAIDNGDCPRLSHKLISAPELSKPLTTSQHQVTKNVMFTKLWCRYQFV